VKFGFLDTPEIRAVFDALAPAQVWAVGGAVRNAVMARVISDIDLATDARPEVVMERAHGAGLRVVPTGIDHGTVTVISGGIPYEITTLRRDVATDGRRATIAYSDNLAEDAARRDFTMNALYALPPDRLVDPLGGLPDAMARRVRFVGDPDRRIAEDALRVLRFFRFHAVYGDPALGIDPEGLAACAAAVDRLAVLSRERIGWEMRKLLSAPDPGPAVAAMAASGVLGAVLPGADATHLPVIVHVEPAPRWQRRLVMITGADVADALRLSRDEAREIAAIRAAVGSALSPAAMAFRWGAQTAEDALLIGAAMMGQAPTHDAADLRRGTAAVFPVMAADLPTLSGPALGQALKDAEARWLASDLRLTRNDLIG
jgi:poly(A) polymerase